MRMCSSSMQEDDKDRLAEWKAVAVRVSSVSCSLNIPSCEWFPLALALTLDDSLASFVVFFSVKV